MAAPDYRSLATAAANRYGIDPNIFLRQIQQESGFDPNARSSAGALGIAQFMPATARGFHINPLDPAQALNAAALMDSRNIAKYGWAGALSAYNSGKADAYKDPNFAGGQTYRYVRSILGGDGGALSAGVGPGSAPQVPAAMAQPRQNLMPAALQYLSSQRQASAMQGPERNQALFQSLLNFRLSAMNQARQVQATQNPGTTDAGAATPPPSSTGGLNPQFSSELSALESAVPGLSVSSGYRSPQEQAVLWQQALQKYGSAAAARQWVAPPGRSMHQRGLAADLHGNLPLAHKLAAKYGLYFPLANEPWHIQPIGT